MTGSSLTTFRAFCKDYYETGEPDRLVQKTDWFLDKLLTNVETIEGYQWIVPMQDLEAQGIGATRTAAQAGAAQSSGGNIGGLQWTISAGDYKGSVYIGDKVMKLTKSNVGSFLRNAKEEIDSLHRAFGHAMATYVQRDSGHSLGSFTESSGTCTLVNKSDIVNFAVGQILTVSANDGTSTGHTLIGSSAVGYVVAVNYNSGVFTVSATAGGNAGTPSNWSGTMYAFRSGDFGGDTTPTRILLGYGSWCPVTDPTSTTFEGINRATNVAARGGIRLTSAEVAGMSNVQRIKALVTRMTNRGWGAPSDLGLNTEKWQSIADELENRGIRPMNGEAGKFSFPKLQMATAGGLIDVWPSRYTPIDACYAPDFSTIRLATPSGRAGFPEVMKGDSLEMVRAATDDYYEHRIVCYPAYVHKAPGRCGRCPIA